MVYRYLEEVTTVPSVPANKYNSTHDGQYGKIALLNFGSQMKLQKSKHGFIQ